MKSLFAFSALLAGAVLLAGAATPGSVIYISHEKVTATFGTRGADNDGRILNEPVKIRGHERSGPGQEVELHENDMDVIYVIDGESTFVTGGTLVGGKVTGPGQIRGTSVQGGQSQRLSKGDVIVVPAGVPHWHKEVPGTVVYYTVKVPKKPGAGAPGPVIHIGHEKVTETFGTRGADNDGRILNEPVKIRGHERSGPGQEVELHENDMDVIYVVDGGCTFVTGGTLVGGKVTGPGQVRGTSIQGGQSQRLSKGDVIVVPAGVPHWHKEVPGTVVYYTVKIPKQ